MTPDQHQQIEKLFKLVELSDEFGELIDLRLVNQWCSLREAHGLAKTVQLITEYAQTESNFTTVTSEIKHTDQNTTMVQ